MLSLGNWSILRCAFLIVACSIIFISYHPLSVESKPLQKLSLQVKSQRYLEIARTKCLKPSKNSPNLYDTDFTWKYSFEEIGELFDKIYNSGKRLPNPVYFNHEKKSFMMPINDTCELSVRWNFIFSVIRHIEEAIETRMADYIFLADMGHGHFYLPKNLDIIGDYTKNNYDEKIFYEILNSDRLEILYHSAEMFLFFGPQEKFNKLPSHLQYRNITRNLVGSFTINNQMTRYISYEFGSPVVRSYDNNLQKVAQDIDISASSYG